MNEITKEEVKAKACAYILHMLLQRLEDTQPGLVEDLLKGAKADQASCKDVTTQPVQQVFAEAIAMLELIHAQNQMASQVHQSP